MPRRKRRLRTEGNVNQEPSRGHQFKKGNPGGPGRPRGSADEAKIRVRILQQLDREQQQIATDGRRKMSPLEFLVWVSQNEDVRLATRIDAAKATLPYLHRKMPIAVEGGDPTKPIVLSPDVVRGMSKEDLLALHALLARTALPALAKPVIDAVAVHEAQTDDAAQPEETPE
jgi:hypothetical protein